MVNMTQQKPQAFQFETVINALNQLTTFKSHLHQILEPIETRETFNVISEDLFMISVNEISNCFYYMNYSNLDEQRRYFHPDNSQRYLSKDQEEIMFDQICEYLWEAEYISSRQDDLTVNELKVVTGHIMNIASTTVAAAVEVFAALCRVLYQTEIGRWYHHHPSATMIRDLAITGHRGCLDIKVGIRF